MISVNSEVSGSDAVADFVKAVKPDVGHAMLDLIIWAWGVLITGVAVFVFLPSVWTFVLAFLVVTSRMGALLALAHEAHHHSLLPSKRWNDLVGAWLCAYPMGSIYGSSRAVHMAHHKYLGTSKDPDRNFHIESNKSTPREFVWHFARLILGGQLWTSIVVNGILRPFRKSLDAQDGADVVVVTRKGHPEILNLVPVQLIIWGALWASSGYWWLYFALWLAPIFTLGAFFGFLRGFVDHAKLRGEPGDGPYEGRLKSVLRTNFLERAFLSPYDFKYHGEHHLCPGVPHYYLPELHRLMQADDRYRSQYGLRQSYSKFLAQYWRQIWATVSEASARDSSG